MQARRTATAPPGVAQPRTLAAAAGAGPKAPLLFTSPIFYVNAVPHIGHLYTTVLVDTLKRWHDFKGHPTIFCTGTDEHGLKIQEAAQAAKMDPKAFCDGISGKFKSLFEQASISHTRFIRTTDEDHYQAVAHFWNQLKDKGYIYKGFHEGWYCVSDETFYPENQVEPSPDNPKAMISKESGKKVEWTREENYKFRLGAFRERLIEWLEANPQVIVPEGQYNFVLSQLKHGDIGDLSVSRLRSRLQWGIPVPDDPDHVIYVWLDALTNYLTVTGYPWTRALPAETEEQAALRCGWPAHVHVVGKDIVKFHAIYWPAFLMAAGLPLPRRIVSHGHWLVGQKKMSKSTGNVVDPHALLAKWGVDPVRYFLMRDGGIAIDPEFSHESVLRRYKHDLGAQLGNLVMRCCSATINKTGQIPAAIGAPLTPDAIELVELVAEAPERIDAEIAVGHLPAALERVEDLIVRLNKYWTDAKPWQLASQQGDAQAKLQSVLFVTYETLRVCALLLQPVMPHKMSLLLDTLDVDAGERTWANARIGKRWARLADGAAPPRQAAVPPKPSPLFPRIDA